MPLLFLFRRNILKDCSRFVRGMSHILSGLRLLYKSHNEIYLYMKRTFIITVITWTCISMSAQTAEPDSIGVTGLKEIVIEAPRVIRKSDMDVYIPSGSAVQNSSNGFQLLNHLMIPSLTVSEALGTIKAAGEAVEIRINGRKATVEQLQTLLPETIKRVEWIDNPGLRYGDKSYVLNFIVSNPSAGGSLMAFALPALNVAWGQYRADLKLNSGRSQWQIGGNYKVTDKIKTYRDYSETFTYPDGTSLRRDEKPDGGSMDYPMANLWASYSYIKPDTTVFVVDFSMPQTLNDNLTYNGLLSLSDGSEDISLTDTKGSKGATPNASLYWQQNIGKAHTLIMSISSSFYSGKTFSDYMERYVGSPELITDIHTDIRDRNRAYAAEADYIRTWEMSRFTAGASWHGNRNRSEYRNLGGEVFHQRQDNAYVFAEYFRRFGRFTATAGIGVQYTQFHFRETDSGNHSWSPRPKATITYSPDINHNFRLGFSSWQTAPSLAETNPVAQQFDGFQWNVGNQHLSTYDNYRLSFRYSFNMPRISGSFGINADTSPHAIAPVMEWDGGKLVTTYENSVGRRQLSFSFAPQIQIIPDWLMASGSIRYNLQRSEGSAYKCRYNDWDGNVSLLLTHWGFTLTGQYSRENRTLWGERITWGETLSVIDLSYNLDKWQFEAGVMMPFGKYDRGSKSLNKWNINEQHIRIDMRIPYLQISYNLQWGRQKRGADKLISTGAETDRSSAAGR